MAVLLYSLILGAVAGTIIGLLCKICTLLEGIKELIEGERS